MARAITREEFIRRAIEIHGDKYGYDEVVYVNMKTKVRIYCKTCKKYFEQTPSDHLHGSGCKQCSIRLGALKQTKTSEEFVKTALERHGDKYLYHKANYVNCHQKVDIYCPIHDHWFAQTAQNHNNLVRPHNCPICSDISRKVKQRKRTEVFISEAIAVHGDKYDYSKVSYVNEKKPVYIICKTHKTGFWQTPDHHLQGEGCPLCNGGVRSNKEDFIAKANKKHNFKYDYSLVDYKNSASNVDIICPKHGIFSQTPNNHLQGEGCPDCVNESQISKGETEIYDFIASHYHGEVLRTYIGFFKDNRHLDIYIPSLKLAIEFDGNYFHSSKFRTSDYHLLKTEYCAKNGVLLLHIFEDEWQFHKEIVKSILLRLLGALSLNIEANDCVIGHVNEETASSFLKENHIEGECISTHRYGLLYNNELVSLMAFSEDGKGKYKVERSCNKLNTNVINGEKRLFEHFINQVKPKEVIASCDRRWGDGRQYIDLGFKFSHNTDVDYKYVVSIKRVDKSMFTKEKLIEEGYDPNKTVEEIMEERKIYRIYDCGHSVYTWEK